MQFILGLCCNKNYSAPLQDAQNASKRTKTNWLKYIVGFQFIIIIILIAIYSKHESLHSVPPNPANDIFDVSADGPNSIGLPSKQFPFRNQYCSDPIGIISELIGRWYGDTGIDTVFGITTYYTEFLTFEPLSYGVVNPKITGSLDDAEQIFGVRFFRQVISNNKNAANHTFAPSTPIHEETGYLLFMFIADSDGNNAYFYRVVKSVAIPRGETVLAEAVYDPDSDGNMVLFDEDNGLVEYVLISGDIQNDEDYTVDNGDFTQQNGMVPSFEQKVRIDLNGHTFSYNQSTPIIFNGDKTQHDNMAILTKLNI